MDVKVALSRTVADTPALNLAEFSTWPLLHQFYASRQTENGLKKDQVLVKPDGFVRIGQADTDDGYRQHRFFLELDRSTEPQRVLAERAEAYTSFYYTGGFAEWFGRPKEAFKQFPFRVLMILKDAARRNNTAERVLLNQSSGLTQIWLTTFEEFTRDPLGAIWIRPADFRHAIRGTAFDPAGSHHTQPYRRQVSRQRHVEDTIQKQRLLTTQSTQ